MSENNLLFLDIKKHFLGTVSDSGKRRKISIEKRNIPNEFSREKKKFKKKNIYLYLKKRNNFRAMLRFFREYAGNNDANFV